MSSSRQRLLTPGIIVLLVLSLVFALNRLQHHKTLDNCEALASAQAVALALCRENPRRLLR